MAHGQYLGTGKALNGSVLVVLCELGLWGNFDGGGRYDQNLQSALVNAHSDFLRWKRLHKLSASQPRFTCSRVNRKHRMMWPVLTSKAIAGKVVSFFLTERAVAWANRDESTWFEKQIATCMWSYTRMVEIMDSGGKIFSPSEAQEFEEKCLLHLQTYGSLHVHGTTVRGKAPGKHCFVLLPKHHYLYHAGVDVGKCRLNPKYYMLLSAESFVGFVGRIARLTHRSSLTLRTLEKYLALMHLHFEQVLQK